MKKPPIDLATNIRLRNEQPTAFVHKFTQYWGTESITDPATGGQVEVFKERQYIYRAKYGDYNHYRESNPKLFKLLGQTEAFKKQRYKGIRSAWLFLNPKKSLKSITNNPEYILDPINELFNTNAKQYFTGLYDKRSDGALVKRMTPSIYKYTTHIKIPVPSIGPIGFTLNNVITLKTELESNYSTIWNTKEIHPYGGIEGIFGMYAPFRLSTSAMTYTIDSAVISTESSGTFGDDYVVHKYLVVTLNITINREFTSADSLVSRIISDYESVHANPMVDIEGSPGYSGKPSAINMALHLRRGILYTGADPTLWIAQGSTYRLKAEPFKLGVETFSLYKNGVRLRTGDLDKPTSSKVPALKGNNRYPLSQTELKMKYLGSLIDSDYEENSCDFWCSITSIVVIVVVVVVAVVTSGAGAALSGAAAGTVSAGAAATAVSLAVMYTYIGLSLASMVSSEVFGNYALAGQLQGIAAAVRPLAQIAGVVLILVGVYSFYDNLTTTAKNTLLSNGIEATSENVFDEVIHNTIPDMVKDTISKAFSTTNLTVTNVLQKIAMFTDMYYKNQYQDAAKKYKKLSDEAAELDQILKQERGNPELGMQIANSANMPLDVIQSPYDMEYYYMPTANNIQACYVRALIGEGSKTYNEYSCKL